MPAPRRFRFGLEVALGLGAAASLLAFVVFVGVPGGGGDATQTAGVAAAATTTVALTAPGFERAELDRLAEQAGLNVYAGVEPAAYDGDARSAARFVQRLKAAAAARNVEIGGLLPSLSTNARVQITVAR